MTFQPFLPLCLSSALSYSNPLKLVTIQHFLLQVALVLVFGIAIEKLLVYSLVVFCFLFEK